MNILFIGDIVGRLGREAVKKNIPLLKKKYDIDFVIANGENITNGKGISPSHYNFLVEHGVDCITLGNHYAHWDDTYKILDNEDIVRPLNLANEKHGAGSRMFDCNGVKIRVTNLIGTNCTPLPTVPAYGAILDIICEDDSDIHIIDYHGEYTGEKKAFAYSLKNTVSAVLGTHTHVQTRDAMKLDTGVLYISDVGMCGLYESVLGVEYESVVKRIILEDDKARFKQKDHGDTLFSAVVLKFDDLNFEGKEIIPLYIVDKEETK